MSKSSTYKKVVYCANCEQITTIEIPKGTLSVGYKVNCPICECVGTLSNTAENDKKK